MKLEITYTMKWSRVMLRTMIVFFRSNNYATIEVFID